MALARRADGGLLSWKAELGGEGLRQIALDVERGADLMARTVGQGAPVNTNDTSAEHADAPPLSAPTRMSWALKRVFEIDIEQCP